MRKLVRFGYAFPFGGGPPALSHTQYTQKRKSQIMSKDYDRAAKVARAIVALRKARDILVDAGAPRATEKVRRALKSAEGAYRHAMRWIPTDPSGMPTRHEP